MDMNTTEKEDLKLSKKYPQDKANEAVESQTKKIPNLTFLGLAAGSIGLSLFLTMKKRADFATFVGLWAPTILLLGVYNKIAKVEDEVLEGVIRH